MVAYAVHSCAMRQTMQRHRPVISYLKNFFEHTLGTSDFSSEDNAILVASLWIGILITCFSTGRWRQRGHVSSTDGPSRTWQRFRKAPPPKQSALGSLVWLKQVPRINEGTSCPSVRSRAPVERLPASSRASVRAPGEDFAVKIAEGEKSNY
jgi:hypothetical protein